MPWILREERPDGSLGGVYDCGPVPLPEHVVRKVVDRYRPAPAKGNSRTKLVYHNDGNYVVSAGVDEDGNSFGRPTAGRTSFHIFASYQSGQPTDAVRYDGSLEMGRCSEGPRVVARDLPAAVRDTLVRWLKTGSPEAARGEEGT